MKLSVCIVLWAIFVLNNAFMDTDLVLSFFKTNYLKYNVVLTCYTKRNQVQLTKELFLQNHMLLAVRNIKHLNILDTLESKYKKIGVVLDGDCKDAKGLLLRCKRYRCFDSKHSWLVLHQSKDYKNLFKYVNLNVDSDIKIAYPKYFSKVVPKQYLIDDVYNPAYERGGEIKTKEVGYYNREVGYYVPQVENKYYVRRNLTGVTFRTMVVLTEPYQGSLDEYLESDKGIEVNTLNRFHSRLMHYCRDYYNFSMDILVDKSWGFLKPDGTMDGLVGALERKKVDFGISPLFVKTDRSKVISYGRKTWNLRAAFMFRNPKSRKSYEIFIKPMSLGVWSCIIISSALSVLTQKLSYGLDKKRSSSFRTMVDATWSYTTLCTFGAFCQQGIISNPKSFCGRIAAIFTLLMGSLVYQFYSASLVSFLLNVPTSVITTVQDILDQNFKIGCEDILYTRDFLKYSTDNVTKEVSRRLIGASNNQSGFLKAEEGLDLVKKGHYAFHVDLATGYPIIRKSYQEDIICELKEVPMLGYQHMHANYQKKSPFKDIMDTCLHRFSENGVLDRELKFWHAKKPECLRSGTTININTGLEDFYPALFVLFIGMILSLQILALEILWYHRSTYMEQLKHGQYPYLD